MTDGNYVAELRSYGMLSTNQAADRIEQLTAERDEWKAAFDDSCNAWQHTCEHEMDRANKAEAERDRAEDELYELQQTCITLRGKNEALTAERDRLREALEQFLIEYDEVDLVNAEPSSLTEAVLEARAALKGESNDHCA